MPLPNLYPLYPDQSGNYNVSLSLPKTSSSISESVGITGSTSFLNPNTDYLKKFISGDIGIANALNKNMLSNNFNNPIVQNDKNIFKKFTQNNNININDIDKYKKEDGRYILPNNEIPTTANSGIGMQGFEKTLLTSIFETQKPYFEAVKLIIGSVAKIEDIIARVCPLLGVPLVTKSLRPNQNINSIGYNNAQELKKALSELQSLSKLATTSTELNTQNENITGHWQTKSIVYSTGVFVPGVDYKYNYIYLPSGENIPNETYELNIEDSDPYNKYKPKNIILGIFKSDGTPLNPNDYLNTIGENNSIVKTNIRKADWVFKSPKWNLPTRLSDNRDSIYVWPLFNSPIYKWENGILPTQNSQTCPGVGWSIKKYKKDDKNLLTNDTAIEGNPIIVAFDFTQQNDYTKYFTDIVTYKMYQSENLTQSEKDISISEIMSKFDSQSQLENTYLYSQNRTSVYKKNYPELMKVVFKPYQIYSALAESDTKLTAYNKKKGYAQGMIWIDPESDYETKVIRVDPTTQIAYKDSQGEPKIKSTIKSFIKNKSTFKLTNNALFNIAIMKNDEDAIVYTNITEYILENWNYYKDPLSAQIPIIQNTNTYHIKIYDDTMVYLDERYDINTLPKFGINKIFVIDNNNVSISDITIPLYQVKIENSDFPYGKIIDSSKINNDELIKDELYSSGKYGQGSNADPQDIEIIKRYMLTDLDTESYYIIEGVLSEKNTQTETIANGVNNNSSKYYRLPHAIGASKIFLLLLVDVFAEILPSLNKITKSFSEPENLVIDTMIEKLGESFSIFSQKSIRSFNLALDIKNNSRNEKTSELIKKLKDIFKDTSLSNYVNIDMKGDFKFLLDGLAMIPFEIFDKKVTFGMNLDFSNLPGSPMKLVFDSNVTETIENLVSDAYNMIDEKLDSIDLTKAKNILEKLNNYLIKNINNIEIRDIVNKLRNKIMKILDNTQPLLKFLLGIITLPMKIIANIIEWLVDFFKSLSNPLKLPSKIAELLSFDWIMDFFTPKGILELASIELHPEKIVEWLNLVTMPKINPPLINPIASTENYIMSKLYYTNATPSNKYLIPDDYEIADLNKIISMPFMSALPTYTAKQFRENPDMALKLFFPILNLNEQIINSIIDFIWALLGIEAIIKSPHIKLSVDSINPDINDAIKLANNLSKDGYNITEPTYLYNITLNDGSIISGLHYNELQKYINEHQDINFQFSY